MKFVTHFFPFYYKKMAFIDDQNSYQRVFPLSRAFSFPKRNLSIDYRQRCSSSSVTENTANNYTYSGYNRRSRRSLSLGDESDLSTSSPKTIRKQISFILEEGATFPDVVRNDTIGSIEEQNEQNQNNNNNNDDEIGNPLIISFMYGLINSTILLPVMLSFGSIIYRDDAFTPYMPLLMKLTLVSAMVHQLCFSTLSSMKFAVGQVQDAGLIFLSSMTSDIVKHCHAKGYSDEVLLATATIGLSLATLLLGIGLVIMGKLKLAQYVQKLPISVINGYLAFIGFFCGVSGIDLMIPSSNDKGDNTDHSSSQVSVASIIENFQYVVPGLLGGIMIYFLVRKIGHISVLPLCITLMLVGFYVILWITGTTVEDVTERGWIPRADPPPVWYHTWDYLRFENVAWEAFPSQTLTLFGMTFVVALSSSLDVAAIEAELSYPLDYNSELTMVGISNIISGTTGGYTGSYIFSQTIFYLRSGIRSRMAGFFVVLCEFALIVLPFNILSYVPNFFFGSLLMMLCVDLMYEYLWETRKKLCNSEYIMCIATFFFIQLLGVEFGILAGLLLQITCVKLGYTNNDGKQTEQQQGASEEDLLILKTNKDNETLKKKLYGAVDIIPPPLSCEEMLTSNTINGRNM